MRFNSEVIYYPNYKDYIEQIKESILYLLNNAENSVGSIIIGEVNSDSDLFKRQIDRKNIEILLESGVIYPKPDGVYVHIVNKFIEIEVKPVPNKSYTITETYCNNQTNFQKNRI